MAGSWRAESDYNLDWQVSARQYGSVCLDLECNLSGGMAHIGPCDPCGCPKRHAIAECPKLRTENSLVDFEKMEPK